MTFNSKLQEILACPVCKGPVSFQDDKVVCQGDACGLRYPIKNGIPVMIAEEAEKP